MRGWEARGQGLCLCVCVFVNSLYLEWSQFCCVIHFKISFELGGSISMGVMGVGGWWIDVCAQQELKQQLSSDTVLVPWIARCRSGFLAMTEAVRAPCEGVTCFTVIVRTSNSSVVLD